MAKDRGDKEESTHRGGGEKLFVGLIWNSAAELKFFLTALLLLCSLATILQFVPARFSLFSTNPRICLTTATVATVANTTAANSVISQPPRSLPPPSSIKSDVDKILPNGVIKRAFNPYGSAAYNFILMSAYRGGPNNFAIMGLASKPLHVFGKPSYTCEYQASSSETTTTTITTGTKILPDWGYGRVYTVIVVNCTFPNPVNTDGSGGRLVLHATTNGGGDTSFNSTDSIDALTEAPNTVNMSYYSNPLPKYDYLYCGSSIYGNLSPQRVREWIAYHVRLFGKRSHFVIHDSGGVHPEVMEVLKPWMELGYVTLHDIRDQERFDGYYHNQFLVVNDCLHRYRFDAQWMFFFDLDEYVYVPGKYSLRRVMESLKDYTQFTIEQMPMSSKLCLSEDKVEAHKKWGFEKLVYRDVKRGIRRDRKYAVQPRDVFATGVHLSQNFQGKTTHKTERLLKYFHYHGTIAERREPCRKLLNDTQLFTMEGTPYVMDTTMRAVGPSVKRFELNTIGPRLLPTRQ